MTRAVLRIIEALRRFPGLSREEIAEHAFVANTTLSGGGYLKSMKEAGLIHISAWRRNSLGVFSIPLFSLGNEEDCSRPRLTPENRLAPGMIRLLEAVKEFGPIDYRQAAQVAGLSPNTVKNSGYLDDLVFQQRIHVSSWRRGRNGPMRPVFEFGPGPQASRPRTCTRVEKSAFDRARRKTMANTCGFVAQLQMVASRSTREERT